MRFRTEAQLRNDRGALPRGRAVAHAHGRTRDIRRLPCKNLTECDRMANDKRNYVATSERKALLQRPIQGRATRSSNTRETKEHIEYKQLVQLKREHLTGHSPYLQIPMQNSGRRGDHGHGHFQQGPVGGIIFHHRTHGDSHHHLPHLTSQRTSWTG